MYLPEPLRNNRFRFRKRKSLHSILYVQGRTAPLRSSDDSPGYGGANIPAAGHPGLETYMSELPEDYVPNPGPMEMPGNDYQPYDGVVTPSVLPPNMPATGTAGLRNVEPHIEYEDGLMSEELFEHQLKQISTWRSGELVSGGASLRPFDDAQDRPSSGQVDTDC